MKHYLLFVSKSYSFEILRPLQAAIRARGDEAAWFLHGVAPDALRKGERLLRTVAEVRAFNPLAVFVPGNWVPDFFPGVKVEVFHGFGIEKRGHFRVRGFFDLYCTHGPATTMPYRALEQRHGYFRVTETGWPKMDPLFAPQGDSGFRVKNGIDRPLVLYAPTFSPSLTSAPQLVGAIAELSRTGRWHWVIKFHPRMAPEWIDAYRALAGPHLTIAADAQLLPLLLAAAVMISDTSSVVSEFLLLDKPVVTFRTKQPGSHVVDILEATQLEDAVTRALQRPAELMEAAQQFIADMHPWRDGRSSERVLAAVDRWIEQGRDRLKRKPLNLWRRLQVRRRLRYYRW